MSVRTLRLSAALAVALSAGACNVKVSVSSSEGDSSSSGTTASAQCGAPGTNTDDSCACLEGYSRCDPSSEDIACCAGGCTDPHSQPVGDMCYCVDGWAPCVDEPEACCAVSGTTTEPTTTEPPGTTTLVEGTTTLEVVTETTAATSDTSTTTTGEECPGEQLPPESCNPGQRSFWCTKPESCGPEGGVVYRCVGGTWVLDAGLADENCNFDGFDFAYGCVDDGNKVEFVCGDGPGTACEAGEPSACIGEKGLQQCIYGKLAEFDCFVQCTEVGDDMGVLYDHGSCGEQDGESVCLCCDEGDAGCPI